MPFLVLLGLFFFIVVLPRMLRSADARARLMKRGLAARGLVLSASRYGSATTQNGQRFEVRRVTMDVEVPGRAPYEVTLSPLFPRWCEPAPGTALDLRVNPRNPNDVAVVGPIGAEGWMGAAANVVPNFVAPGSRAASGCGTAVIVIIMAALAFGAIVNLIASATSSSSDKPHATPEPTETSEPTEPETPHVVPPPHVAPAPHATHPAPHPAPHPSATTHPSAAPHPAPSHAK